MRMVTMTDPERERMTTAFTGQLDGDFYGAVAWRGDKIIAIEFFDILAPKELHGTYPFRRELRIYEMVGDLPLAMSQEELQDRLELWIANDRALLPAVQFASDVDAYPVSSYSSTDVRMAPLPQMEAEVIRAFAVRTLDEEFIGPTPEECEILLNGSDSVGFKSMKTLESHLEQLQVVAAYVKAIESNSPHPLKDVAENLGIPHVRARNRVQFARDNAYLSGGQNKGRAVGYATTESHRVMQVLREHIRNSNRKAEQT